MKIEVLDALTPTIFRGRTENVTDTYGFDALARAEALGSVVEWRGVLEPTGYRNRVRHFAEPHR